MEKEKQKNIKVKDNRKSRIAGLILIFFSIFLVISFLSYLVTWKEDQSIISAEKWNLIFNKTNVKNITGRFGALFAHFLFNKSFGISSFLICIPLFTLGVNKLLQRKVYKFYKILFYSIICLFYFSTTFSLLFSSFDFPFSGAIGNYILENLKKFIGIIGAFLILIVVPILYIMWIYNPEIYIPKKIFTFFNKIKNIITQKKENNKIEQTIDTNKNNIENIVLYDNKELEVNTTQNNNLLFSKNKIEGQSNFKFNYNNFEKNQIEFEITEKEIASKENLENINLNEINDLNQNNNNINEIISEPILQNNDREIYTNNDLLTPKKEEIFTINNLNDNVLNYPKEEISFEINDSNSTKVSNNENIISNDINISKTNPKISFINILSPKQEITNTSNSFINFVDPTSTLSNFITPFMYKGQQELLASYNNENIITDNEELQKNKEQIISTLKNYDISIDKIRATIGPTVTLYEIVPSPGVRISKIRNLEDDIALSLAALGIRIIAPIPGKGTIGIEVPNLKKSIVSMKNLVNSTEFKENKFSLPIALGKTIDNQNYIVDLSTMPHMLMAGATGQGKSVGINTILVSLLWKKHPSELKFVLIDPKKVELSVYRTIEKHYLAKLPNEEEAIITDTKKVVHTINALCIEMDNRYDLLKNAGTRNIKEYNEKFLAGKLNQENGHKYLPFIVLVIDEFADLIMTAGKEVEMPIARLAQLARAIGIHLIIATQRPSVNIITGIIKANFPVRIAFKVSSKIDSRTILDAGGADQLIGKGDMLISHNGDLTRLQCAFVDTPEVEKIVNFISSQESFETAFLLPEYIDPKDLENGNIQIELNDHDSNFEEAARLIIQKQVASTSLIQRFLKLGYNRAGRIMDQLEQMGIVGPAQGSKPRELKVKTETELNQILNNMS